MFFEIKLYNFITCMNFSSDTLGSQKSFFIFDELWIVSFMREYCIGASIIIYYWKASD